MNNITRRKRKKRIGLILVALAMVIAMASLVTLIHASLSPNPVPRLAVNSGGNQTVSHNAITMVSQKAASATPMHSATATAVPTQTAPPTATAQPAAPTIVPVGAAGAGSIGGTGGPWQLVYTDNFAGTQLDPTWGTYNGPHGGGDSYYSPSEVTVSNGMMHLWMERKVTGGLPYTTGGVAVFRLAQVYGKYVMRVRLPYGTGVGPYAILWPNSPNYVAQTDLFESPPATKNELFFTNHGINGGPTTQVTAMGNFAAGFHTLTYEWSPNKLQFYVDGVSQGVLTQSIPNQSMWFGIAVACGDAFTGNPNNTTVLPASLDVSMVQIYKYTG